MVRMVFGGVALALFWAGLAATLPQAGAQIILLPCPDCPPEAGQPVAVESGHFSEFLEPGPGDDTPPDVALFAAIRRGELSYVQALTAAGVRLVNHDQNGLTPLAWAAQYGRLEIVDYLLSRGVPRNPQDYYGYTPLMWAAQQGHVRIVEALLRAGANPRVKTRQGVDALLLARVGRHAAVERLLRVARAGRLKASHPPASPVPLPAIPVPRRPTPRPLPSVPASGGIPVMSNSPVASPSASSESVSP